MWLQYQDLIIRNALAEDAQQLAAWWNDGSIMAHAGFPNGVGKSVQDIADSLQKDSDVTQRRLIVQIDRTPIGEMNYRTAGRGIAEIVGKSVQDIADSLQKDSDVTQRRLIVQIDRTPIGEMNYRTAGRGIAEIGINLCESSTQNRGLGKILLSMLISSLFSDMGYQKIRLDTDLRNTRAQHVYEQESSTQNRGLGKILLSMLISSLFSDMGYQKIRLDTDLRNTRAQHVYEQLGFTKLRVNENSWTDQLGEQRSSVDYELIPENFICFLD